MQASLMKQQKQLVSSKREAKQKMHNSFLKLLLKQQKRLQLCIRSTIESEKARELKIQYNKILHDIPKILNEEEM